MRTIIFRHARGWNRFFVVANKNLKIIENGQNGLLKIWPRIFNAFWKRFPPTTYWFKWPSNTRIFSRGSIFCIFFSLRNRWGLKKLSEFLKFLPLYQRFCCLNSQSKLPTRNQILNDYPFVFWSCIFEKSKLQPIERKGNSLRIYGLIENKFCAKLGGVFRPKNCLKSQYATFFKKSPQNLQICREWKVWNKHLDKSRLSLKLDSLFKFGRNKGGKLVFIFVKYAAFSVLSLSRLGHINFLLNR